jgi:recombinase-like zinc beta ribbon protein
VSCSQVQIGSGNKHGFLLRGLVRCVACGSAMTSSTSAPRGKPHRYNCCTSPRRRGTGECPVRAVSAAELERFVVDRIGRTRFVASTGKRTVSMFEMTKLVNDHLS